MDLSHSCLLMLGSAAEAERGQDSKGRQVDVWTNFAAYELQPPVGLLRADSHLPPFRPGLAEFMDAIVCDPPYGVRSCLH